MSLRPGLHVGTEPDASTREFAGGLRKISTLDVARRGWTAHAEQFGDLRNPSKVVRRHAKKARDQSQLSPSYAAKVILCVSHFNDRKEPIEQATGIRIRHSRRCRSREGGKCNCDPSYEAWVWSPRAMAARSARVSRLSPLRRDGGTTRGARSARVRCRRRRVRPSLRRPRRGSRERSGKRS